MATRTETAHVENLKSSGKYHEAGALARKIGADRAYGCHFGMRSSRERAMREFYEGYDANYSDPREEAAAKAKSFFENTDNVPAFLSEEITFSIQLPYANKDGRPICADIKWYEAEALCVRHKTHRLMKACDGYYVVTPMVAAKHMVFQIGCEPL